MPRRTRKGIRSAMTDKKVSVSRLRSRRKGSTSDGVKSGLIVSGVIASRTPVATRLQSYVEPSLFREGTHTHVSDLVGKCPRALALMSHFPETHVVDTIRPGVGVTFAIGSAIGDYIVKTALRTFGHAEVYADWSCFCGETHQIGVKDDYKDVRCPTCLSGLVRHHEFLMQDEEYRITGSVDLVAKIQDALYFTEVKSIAGNGFAGLNRAMPDHVSQVLLYWWLARRLGYSVHSTVSILYVNKEWTYKSPFREFVIEAEDLVDKQHVLQPYLDDALLLVPFKKKEGSLDKLPVRPCPSKSSPQSKKCVVSAECWGCGNGDGQ